MTDKIGEGSLTVFILETKNENKDHTKEHRLWRL